MSITHEESSRHASDSSTARCPVDHSAWSQRKTARATANVEAKIEHDPQGTWHINGFSEARSILRSGSTKQAGFNAETIANVKQIVNPAILFLEGQPHHQQRKQTAKFFTPKTVSSSYHQLMETQVTQLMADLKQKQQADLSQMSLALAVSVAAQVVGLTDSRMPGMAGRLESFFNQSGDKIRSSLIRKIVDLKNQSRIFSFFFLDVKPAIRARKKSPQEDVISHLLTQNYSDVEILTECVTYAAAGMVTTREFISVAAWHLLEQPELRARYLAGDDRERNELLQEILRLEPVVSSLYRRTTEDVTVTSQGEQVLIPQGELINVHIHNANADSTAVGEAPLAICPARKLSEDNITPAVMSFGDGHHRCPGSYIAIQEADIFLKQLLSIETLHIKQPPIVHWNDLVQGYEIRNFQISI